MAETWLSLHKAAEMIGVHPSTVRSWADHGKLPVHRTQGGHRRFLKEDIELWLNSHSDSQQLGADLVEQTVLKRTRIQISEGGLSTESWYQKLDDEARQQYRLSGRSLLQGLISQLNSGGKSMEAEARSLGFEYASRGKRCGLSSVEATHAFLFFRNMLVDSMLSVYETAGIRSPQTWVNMIRRINVFTDLILITLLETLEAFQRGAR